MSDVTRSSERQHNAAEAREIEGKRARESEIVCMLNVHCARLAVSLDVWLAGEQMTIAYGNGMHTYGLKFIDFHAVCMKISRKQLRECVKMLGKCDS